MADITIKEVMELKECLESDLVQVISEALQSFREDTGIAVERVDVSMVDATALGDAHPSYLIGEVRVYLGL